MMQPSRRLSFAAIVVFGLLPFVVPLLRGEIFSFRDHADYFVPLRHFTAESLRAGELPAWNPYNGSGERWLANPQTAIFYPPAIVFLAVPFRIAYMLFLAFHVVLLGVGSLLLFRRWSSPSAALFGAVAVMLGGPSLSLLDINNNLATFAWLPLLLWIANVPERSFVRLSIPAGIVLALMFLGGEPYFSFMGAAIFAAVLLFRREVPQLAAAGIAAAGLSAIQLLPFLEMLGGSDRTAGLSRDLAFAESLAPLEWGVLSLSPLASPAHLIPMTQQFIPSLYLGPLAALGVFLLVFSLSAPRDSLPKRAAIGFAVMFVVFCVIAAGSYVPLLADLILRSGLAVSRHASRVAPVAALALVGLAAIGFDRLRDASRFARIAAVGATVALMAIAAERVVLVWRDAPLRSFAPPLVMIAVIGGVVLARPRSLQRAGYVLAGCAIVAIDLVAGSSALLESERFAPSVPEYANVISSDRRVLRLEESHSGRLFKLDRRAWYTGYLNLLDRKYDVATPAPVVPERYLHLYDVVIEQARLDVADFLSAAYIATSRELKAPALTRIARVGRVNLYRNAAAQPMMTLWRDFVPAGSPDDALRMIEQRQVDVRRAPVISSPPRDLRLLLAGTAKNFDAKISYQLATNRAGALVRSTQPVILSFSQTAASGWRLTIDGTPAESLRVNGLFLGAFVPAGVHRVRWSYRAPYLVAGATISILSLLAILTFVVVARRRVAA